MFGNTHDGPGGLETDGKAATDKVILPMAASLELSNETGFRLAGLASRDGEARVRSEMGKDKDVLVCLHVEDTN